MLDLCLGALLHIRAVGRNESSRAIVPSEETPAPPHNHRITTAAAHADIPLLFEMYAPASPIITTPAAAAAARPPGRHVVRPAGVLVELLGAAELGEDELLLRLRELGLITYPSPLLGGLLEQLPEVLAAEVLLLLEPTDLVVFGQAGRACRAAVSSACRKRRCRCGATRRGARVARAPRREGRFSLGSRTLSGQSRDWLGQRRGDARGTRRFALPPRVAGAWRC